MQDIMCKEVKQYIKIYILSKNCKWKKDKENE